MRTVLGIDPGSEWTGLAIRRADLCLDASTVGRGRRGADGYVRAVTDRIEEMIERHPVDGYAVEMVKLPQPALNGKRAIRPNNEWIRHLVGTALVIGAVLDHFDPVEIVPTGHHEGRKPRELYRQRPRQFSPTDEPRGDRRHEVDAWRHAGVLLRVVTV